jgi:hypothetical protein
MKKGIIIVLIVISLVAVGCTNTPQVSTQNDNAQAAFHDVKPAKIEDDFVPEDGAMFFSTYDYGYDSVDDLMNVATLVVRATPVAKESESQLGVCWIMDVAEASVPGIKTIKLVQNKDNYLLEPGQEVVLVLQPDKGEDYFNIPGGGNGLFFVNRETQSVDGQLMDSLLEKASLSAQSSASLDLAGVFELLVKNL